MNVSRDYRDYVGPRERYPLVGLAYRDLLDAVLPSWCDGPLLDVGCGSLRIGKELMPRMPRGTYCGIEPHTPVVDAALAHEHGGRILELFAPRFSASDCFDVSSFGCHFPTMICYAVFIHCGRAQLHQFLNNIRDHVAAHRKPVALVLDLRIEDVPQELPESGRTAYQHASHNVSSYVHGEVAEILSGHGGELVARDLYLSCDGRGVRRQHLINFPV